MKMKKLLLPLLLAFTLTSCGSDDDNSKTPERQEDTTGTNGTTGSTGTTGTTGGGNTTSCLTRNQRENIRTFLNRLSDLRVFNGSGTIFTFDPPDLEVTRNFQGTINFSQSSENSWLASWVFLDPEDPAFRETDSQRFSFNNGCLLIDGIRARNVNASDSNLSYRYTVNGKTVRDSTSLSSGRLKIRSSVTERGIVIRRDSFNQD